MVHPALFPFLLALAAPLATLGDARTVAGEPVELAQLTIHEHIVIRVPRMPLASPVAATPDLPVARLPVWKEKKGPKCVAVAAMAGAIVTGPRAVDLVMLGGRRVRAKLDKDCTPLDFYSGFYMRPSDDGMACAGRDAIRVRSGASCDIDSFRALVAKR